MIVMDLLVILVVDVVSSHQSPGPKPQDRRYGRNWWNWNRQLWRLSRANHGGLVSSPNRRESPTHEVPFGVPGGDAERPTVNPQMLDGADRNFDAVMQDLVNRGDRYAVFDQHPHPAARVVDCPNLSAEWRIHHVEEIAAAVVPCPS